MKKKITQQHNVPGLKVAQEFIANNPKIIKNLSNNSELIDVGTEDEGR